jgi:site-specific DNA recombinase
MQGLIAEYERAKIAERTRRGRFHKAKTGNIMGGTGPYGYDYVHKTSERGAYYKINPDEAEIVRLIFSLYLKNQSTAAVVRELNERGIRPRCGAQIWSKGLIHRMLCNECYIGNAYYNKRDKSDKKCKPRERNEWIPIKIPSIINEETFWLVQEILKSHRGGKRTRTYLLSSLMKCKKCGSKYIGSSSNRNHYYYRCGNIVKRYPLPKNCDAKAVRAERLENAVLHAIQRAILKPHILVDHIIDLYEKTDGNGKELKRIRRILLNRKEKLKDKKKRVLDLYSEGLISKEEFVEKQNEIESKNRELEKEITEIDYKISNKIDKSLVIKNINYFSELAKERIESLSAEETQEFLRYLIQEIIFDSQEKTAHIIGSIPIMKEDLNLFQIAPRLSGETWNKKLRFELKVKVKV